MSALLAVQALSVLLTTITEATKAATALGNALEKANLEGRDITPEELAAIQAENTGKLDEVLAKLGQ